MKETEFLGSAERSIGMLYLSRHQRPDVPDDWVYDVHIDGALLMSSDSPLSERLLATRAIEAHPGESLRVLVGGLGLGYTAQAALDSPRASLVRVVDAMDFVIGWLQQGLLPLSKSLTTDERVQLVQGDVYADLLGPASETWDVILVDVDHAPDMPLDPASLVFYTPEGQARVREHLAPGGVLAVWSAHDNDDFAAVLDQVYAEAWREHIEWNATRYDDSERPLHNILFFGRKP